MSQLSWPSVTFCLYVSSWKNTKLIFPSVGRPTNLNWEVLGKKCSAIFARLFACSRCPLVTVALPHVVVLSAVESVRNVMPLKRKGGHVVRSFVPCFIKSLDITGRYFRWLVLHRFLFLCPLVCKMFDSSLLGSSMQTWGHFYRECATPKGGTALCRGSATNDCVGGMLCDDALLAHPFAHAQHQPVKLEEPAFELLTVQGY